MKSPLSYFSELRAPRVEPTREHLLEDILLMAVAAVLSGAGSWNEIAGYCRAKSLWLRSFLKLPGGIPSHNTFNRVISAHDPAELEKGFTAIPKLLDGLRALHDVRRDVGVEHERGQGDSHQASRS